VKLLRGFLKIISFLARVKQYVRTEKALNNKPAEMNMLDYIKIYTGALVYAIINYYKIVGEPKKLPKCFGNS
jgi:hypothetical protein